MIRIEGQQEAGLNQQPCTDPQQQPCTEPQASHSQKQMDTDHDEYTFDHVGTKRKSDVSHSLPHKSPKQMDGNCGSSGAAWTHAHDLSTPRTASTAGIVPGKRQNVNPSSSTPKAQSKLPGMSHKTQATMVQFLLQPPFGAEDVYDLQEASRYVSVFSSSQIAKASRVRKEYMLFWNENAKDAIKVTKKRAEIAALIEDRWRSNGRFLAYARQGKELARLHNGDINWDQHYQEIHKSLSYDKQELHKELKKLVEEQRRRFGKGDISQSDKVHLSRHITSVKKEIDAKDALIEKNMVNWRTRLTQIGHKGFSKKKPGPNFRW